MRGVVVALGLAALLGGCSLALDPGKHMGGDGGGEMDATAMDSGTPDADASVPPLAANNVCPAMAAVFCAGRRNCCTTMETPADCETRANESCERWLGPVLLEDNTNYNPARGGVLLQMGQAAADSCSDDIIRLVADRSGLLSAMEGRFGDGEACEANTGMLLIDAVARLFTCTEGNGCRDEGVGGWVCRPLSGMGDPCNNDYDCLEGMYCGDLDNTCVDRRMDGLVCDRATQCQSLYCTTTCDDPDQDTVWCFDPSNILPMPMAGGM